MRSGHVWEPVCSKCGHGDGGKAVWQEERPDFTPTACGWCLAPGDDAVWEHSIIPTLGYMRLSGFSTSESDFTPHWNRAFGQPVHSLAEMKALQDKSGSSDMVVKGDALERHAPRDLMRRIKRSQDIQKAVDSGTPYDAGNGVRVEFTNPTED